MAAAMSTTILTLPAPEGNGTEGGDADQQLQQEPPKPPPPGAKADPPATVATHTRTIGIIHPPPDIRVIIEKTATFVAKNGPEFERRIISHNQGNAKFNFLQPSDPYHAYYQHRVSEIGAAPPGADAASAAAVVAAAAAPADGSAADAKADHSAPFRVAPPPKVLVPPKAELYTVRLPEGITGEELDIIKLTAQFVARNGKNFLTSLAQRENNNMQFHFIRPTHSMFPFFTALTDAYSRVLRPAEGVPALLKELREGSKDLTTVLERCLNRLEWDRSQEQARQQAEDEIEQERMQMSMIDWHDFVVVETIEFADDEYEGLPVPLTLEELKRQKRMENLGEEEAMDLAEPAKEVEMDMDEEEMQLVEEGMRAAQLEENDGGAQVNVAGDDDAPMRIVKNYKRPEERTPT
jgi:splicing factor 3A subunit 1